VSGCGEGWLAGAALAEHVDTGLLQARLLLPTPPPHHHSSGQKVMYDAVMDVIFKQLPHIK
jgi:hypothetical protein